MRRLLTASLWPAALVLLLVAVTAGSAAAHGDLESGSPGPGDSLAPGGTLLSLTFGGVDPDGPARLALTDADGRGLLVGEAVVVGDRTVCASTEPLPVGVLALDYSVTGVDGHPSRGRYAFEVLQGGAAPAPGACAAARLPAPGEVVSADESGSGLVAAAALLALLVVALAGSAVAARRLRGRTPPSPQS